MLTGDRAIHGPNSGKKPPCVVGVLEVTPEM